MTGKQLAVGLSSADKVFFFICHTWILLCGIVVLYPLLWTVASSFSDSQAIAQGKVSVYPVGFTLQAYVAIFNYRTLWQGFFNQVFYTVGATVMSTSLTLLAAYPISRRDMPFRKTIQTLFVITMFVSGGLIPSYLLMRNLHLVGTRWSQIIPAGVSVYNMILVRTYIRTAVPDSIRESTQMDGCGDIVFFFKFVLPLIVPVIALIVLWAVVGNWQSYFNAMIYLTKPAHQNFQQVLRNIMISTSPATDPAVMDAMLRSNPDALAKQMEIANQLKYSSIVVGALPMMMLYPFIQKYFRSGVMMGSLKE
ncbi:sugar ABC transporter permease [Spirochaetia bacterium]|nr:sugar ABC transporter permease [Spirochaetia bacterium]